MAGLFSAAELTELQGLVVSTMPDVAQVQRPTVTSDGAGGSTMAFVNHGAPVSCLLSARDLSLSERETAGRVGLTTLWDIQLPTGTDVLGTDRLVIDGRTFEITAVVSGSYPVSLRLLAAEVT